MEGRYGISDLVGWGWLLKFQEPRSREHSRALQKQMLTHDQAKLTAPTSEGTAMSSLGLYYSYTVQLTCLKIPLRASLCWQRKVQNRNRFSKGKTWIPIWLLSLTSYMTSPIVTHQCGRYLPHFKGKRQSNALMLNWLAGKSCLSSFKLS